MRHRFIRATVCAFALAFTAFATASAQTKAKAENVPEIPMRSAPDFIKMPVGLYLGEAMGVAKNSQGHFFVFTRSGDTRLFEFDATGKYVKEWGKDLYGFEFAHKVRVDSLDNVWAVDEGSNQVIKFNPQGRVEMVIGVRPEAVLGVLPAAQMSPLNGHYTFARPTDVAFDARGNIFISDGYTNSRVVKFDKDGRFVGQFATNVRGGAPDQLNTPHTIATDAQGNVYVGDRGNARVQVLDNDLKLKATYDNVGNPWEMCISPGPHQYLFVSNSNPDNNGAASWNITGEVYMMELDGRIIGRFGKAGKAPGQFQTIHGLDCSDPHNLLVAEITAWRVQKITLDYDALIRRTP
jgi:hypothetical protein